MSNYSDKNNMVILKGQIASEPVFSHSCMGESFEEVVLRVPRLSDECDYIPLTISSRLGAELKVGQMIGVVGNFRSYNKLENGKSKLLLTVFVRQLADPDTIENSNQINVTGYLCKEPIYRTTPFGREITDCLIAVNRGYNKSDYLPCIAWGRNAVFVSGIPVGEKIELSGRIQSREYQKRLSETEVETRTAYEVSISRLALVSANDNAYDDDYEETDSTQDEVCFVTN